MSRKSLARNLALLTTIGTTFFLISASPVSSGDEAAPAAQTADGTETAHGAENGGRENGKTDNASSAPTLQITGANPGCLVDQTVLTDIESRMAELSRREKAAATREEELNAREKALSEELAKIANVRDEVAKIEALRKKEGQEKVAKLVETLQGMSPKAAAQLLSTVDETLAVSAIAQMDTKKLSKIMNVMESSRSARLSEILAGVARAKGGWKQSSQSTMSNDVVATRETKGGESNGNVDNHSKPEQPSGPVVANAQR